MTDLLSLAERVERATGPDRELDADIALTQGWAQLPGDNWCGPYGSITVPAFTASIDAAMTLCTGMPWTLATGPVNMAIVGKIERYVEAATPALALVAASLRAIAAQSEVLK